MAVDDQAESRERLQSELVGRYAHDYRVVIESSPVDALETLRAIHAGGEPVAVVMASVWMSEMSGGDMLAAVRDMLPRTKRAVLIPFGGWGDRATARAIRGGVASGGIDRKSVV